MGESHEGARERKGVLSDPSGGAGKQDGCCLPAGQGSGDGRKTGDGRQWRRNAERDECGGVPGDGKGGYHMKNPIEETKELTRYQWLKMHGICVACGQKDAFPGYVRCPECIEKAEEASRKCWADDEKRIRYNKHGAERHKELIQERKANGLCPRCGKVVKGKYVYCDRCREKHNASRRAKNMRRPGEHFRERIEAGICMYCGGELVPGYKLCESCLEKYRDIHKHSNQRASIRWRKEITEGWNARKRSSVNG